MADQRAQHSQDSVGGGRTVDILGFDQIAILGTGGSATVYRAYDLRHQRWIAIKVLDGQATDDRQRRAFDREVQALGRIGSHPYIVAVLGSGFTPTNHRYLILPLFERGTFAQLVDEHGPLTWPEAIDVGIKLCSAVESVHRAGVVHRDIKPGNVFVGVSPAQPLLGDFGISSLLGSERTKTSNMPVTFGYTAPEILDDERPTVASDIYSLGMTVYRLIQGLPAFHAETPAALMRKVLDGAQQPRLSAGVPAGLAEVVLATLATRPVDRPDSALTVARRLQQVQADAGLAITEVLVADESPNIPRPGPSAPGIVRSGSGPGTPPGASVPAPRSRADRVGRVLAAALDQSGPATPSGSDGSELVDRPPRPDARTHTSVSLQTSSTPLAAGPAETGPVGGGAGTDRRPLDLPTTYEPRVPRPVRQRQQPEPSTSRRSVRIGLAVVALVLIVIALYAGLGYTQGWWPFQAAG